MNMSLALLAVLGLAAVAAVVLWRAGWRWERATASLRRRLAGRTGAAAAQGAGAPLAPPDLDGLPVPVAAWLRRVVAPGRAGIRRARIAWRGTFNLGRPGRDRWRRFTARQDVQAVPPGFVWDATIRLLPFVPLWVRDGFVAGEGSMRGAVAGIVPVVGRAGTPGLAEAALQRWLAEAVWTPWVLLPHPTGSPVAWQTIDDRRARATVTASGVTASVDFHFDGDGRVESVFVPDRLYDDGKRPPAPTPWRARLLAWGDVSGHRVPTEAVAEWIFPAGPFAVWRGGPEEIETEG